MKPMLEYALWYQQKGFSVIPAKKDKKPFIKWQEFQKTPPTEVQIREWWQEWPNANIAIITGINSGITVVDADSQAGKNAIEDMLPESLAVPVVKTPRGWHYYFKYAHGVRNGVQVLTDCDIRSEGGYVIAPPSKNGQACGYEWVTAIGGGVIPEIPSFLLDTILSSNQNTINNPSLIQSLDPYYNTTKSLATKKQHDSNISNIRENPLEIIPFRRRDEIFFHLAYHLVKSGMNKDNIRFFLRLFLCHCTEQSSGDPYTEKDIEAKIESALKRQKDRDKVSTEMVREYVLATSGNFLVTDVYHYATLATSQAKAKVRAILSRMVNEGLLEKTGKRDGVYRRIETELNEINIFDVQSEFLDIKYPLDLHELFKTMPRNIIIIAGTPNVGKTAFLLNFCSLNMNRGMPIRYFTSEMGEMELANRCRMFEPDVPFSFWKNVQFCDCSSNFADKLEPDGINIIDFLEMPNEFWLVGEKLTAMYERLNRGIAVVALQKKFGQKLGRGAEFSLEKPRLYVTLESNPPEGNIAEIVKCKNHARDDLNPNHMECVFNVIQGVKIRQCCSWSHPRLKEV